MSGNAPILAALRARRRRTLFLMLFFLLLMPLGCVVPYALMPWLPAGCSSTASARSSRRRNTPS